MPQAIDVKVHEPRLVVFGDFRHGHDVDMETVFRVQVGTFASECCKVGGPTLPAQTSTSISAVDRERR